MGYFSEIHGPREESANNKKPNRSINLDEAVGMVLST